MALGPGYTDPQGIWQFGEDDVEILMSDLLNVGQVSVSQQLTLAKGRLAVLEQQIVGAISPSALYTLAGTIVEKAPNDWVDVELIAIRTSGLLTTGDDVGTLPAGFRPRVSQFQPVSTVTAPGYHAVVRILTTGVITLFTAGSAVAGQVQIHGPLRFKAA